MDKNYWKEAYSHLWSKASQKEEAIKGMIEHETGMQVEIVGLGAGSDKFIAGSASDNKMQKGDADLYIPKLDCYIEVTGPNIPMKIEMPLWFRPDKLKNTETKLRDRVDSLHFVVHVLDEKGTQNKVIRVINLNVDFFSKHSKGQFKDVRPFIRGREERYTEIPFNSEVILQWDEFIALLKSLQT